MVSIIVVQSFIKIGPVVTLTQFARQAVAQQVIQKVAPRLQDIEIPHEVGPPGVARGEQAVDDIVAQLSHDDGRKDGWQLAEQTTVKHVVCHLVDEPVEGDLQLFS